MGKMTAAPRYNVISLRISDQELAAIQTLRDDETQTMSDVIRQALRQLIRDIGEDHGLPSHDNAAF